MVKRYLLVLLTACLWLNNSVYWRFMKLSKLMLALSLTAASIAAQAAGTLIFCSEASPEGFDSSQYTGGTTFDASGHALFNRLVEFKKGTTDIAPSLAESFAGLPPALVIAAEFDPLRVENERYAEALKSAGVAVTYRLFPGCMHAFTHFGPEAAANDAWRLIQDSLRQAFWGREAVFDGER